MKRPLLVVYVLVLALFLQACGSHDVASVAPGENDSLGGDPETTLCSLEKVDASALRDPELVNSLIYIDAEDGSGDVIALIGKPDDCDDDESLDRGDDDDNSNDERSERINEIKRRIKEFRSRLKELRNQFLENRRNRHENA